MYICVCVFIKNPYLLGLCMEIIEDCLPACSVASVVSDSVLPNGL